MDRLISEMKKEERSKAIEYLKSYRTLDEKLHNMAPLNSVSYYATDICLKYWDMAIEALAISSAELPISVLEDIKAEILLRAENVKSIRTDGHCFFTADEILEIIDKHIGKGAIRNE